MAKKQRDSNNLENVDLENGIVHGILKQIKYNANALDPKNPSLITVWCCDIIPRDMKSLVAFLRECITPYDTRSLVHVKRFNKAPCDETKKDSSPVIQTIICSTDFIRSEEELREYFKEFASADFDSQNLKFYKKNIPSLVPLTKEIAQEWSSKYWPMSWKGNPNHQILKSVEFDISEEKAMIKRLIQELKDNCNLKVPVVSIIAKKLEDKTKILDISFDNRDINPLEHSIMKGIDKIANFEKKRRALSNASGKANIEEHNYLCHNLIIYTTHEPCIMCSMALVHSRVGRVIYMKDSPVAGGFETNYQLGDREGLNWKFEIWKWIGDDELHELENAISGSMHNINI